MVVLFYFVGPGCLCCCCCCCSYADTFVNVFYLCSMHIGKPCVSVICLIVCYRLQTHSQMLFFRWIGVRYVLLSGTRTIFQSCTQNTIGGKYHALALSTYQRNDITKLNLWLRAKRYSIKQCDADHLATTTTTTT